MACPFLFWRKNKKIKYKVKLFLLKIRYIKCKIYTKSRKGEYPVEDRELIRKIHRGQKQYLNVIAEKYYDDIYRFCCYQTGDRQESYDLAQETFLRFIRYVDQYRYQNLKGYLITIARNVCMDYFRKEKCRQEKELEIAELEKSIQSREQTEITLEELTRNLSESQREAIILYYGYGFKYREIAKITGVPLSTVKSRIKQGIEKLRLGKEEFYG